MREHDILAALMLIPAAATAALLCVAAACACAFMLKKTWEAVRPKRKKRREIVAAEIVEQSRGCSEAGSKFCEMRGCAILGSCQRPTEPAPRTSRLVSLSPPPAGRAALVSEKEQPRG